MSAAWQTASYVLRILSIKYPTIMGYYAGWFILILVCTFLLPVWHVGTRLNLPGVSLVDECVRLHGHGKDGLQLHIQG